MQTPNKPSLLNKLLAMASRLGESAKQALHKSNTAKKDAAVKVAQYEKTAKAAIKEAKTVSKTSTTPAAAAPAKKATAKKVAAKPVAAKKVTAAAPAKKTADKKVPVKTVAAKKASPKKGAGK